MESEIRVRNLKYSGAFTYAEKHDSIYSPPATYVAISTEDSAFCHVWRLVYEKEKRRQQKSFQNLSKKAGILKYNEEEILGNHDLLRSEESWHLKNNKKASVILSYLS